MGEDFKYKFDRKGIEYDEEKILNAVKQDIENMLSLKNC